MCGSASASMKGIRDFISLLLAMDCGLARTSMLHFGEKWWKVEKVLSIFEICSSAKVEYLVVIYELSNKFVSTTCIYNFNFIWLQFTACHDDRRDMSNMNGSLLPPIIMFLPEVLFYCPPQIRTLIHSNVYNEVYCFPPSHCVCAEICHSMYHWQPGM